MLQLQILLAIWKRQTPHHDINIALYWYIIISNTSRDMCILCPDKIEPGIILDENKLSHNSHNWLSYEILLKALYSEVYYYPGHWFQYQSCSHSAPSQLPEEHSGQAPQITFAIFRILPGRYPFIHLGI